MIILNELEKEVNFNEKNDDWWVYFFETIIPWLN